MNEHVAIRMGRSATAFRDIVWPAVREHLGGADAFAVEAVTDAEFAKQLDMVAGIDAWVIPGGRYVRGLASRVQWPRTGLCYRTFTVRYAKANGARTEYAKRRQELVTVGAITPHYWCHAYLRPKDNGLLGAAVALTRDIITLVGEGVGYERHNPADGTSFWCVDWDELRSRQMSLIEVGADGSRVWPRANKAAA